MCKGYIVKVLWKSVVEKCEKNAVEVGNILTCNTLSVYVGDAVLPVVVVRRRRRRTDDVAKRERRDLTQCGSFGSTLLLTVECSWWGNLIFVVLIWGAQYFARSSFTICTSRFAIVNQKCACSCMLYSNLFICCYVNNKKNTWPIHPPPSPPHKKKQINNPLLLLLIYIAIQTPRNLPGDIERQTQRTLSFSIASSLSIIHLSSSGGVFLKKNTRTSHEGCRSQNWTSSSLLQAGWGVKGSGERYGWWFLGYFCSCSQERLESEREIGYRHAWLMRVCF